MRDQILQSPDMIINSYRFGTAAPSADFGGASRIFNGSTDYLDIPNISASIVYPFTIAAFFKTDNAAIIQCIGGVADSGNFDNRHICYLRGDLSGELQTSSRSTGSQDRVYTTSNLATTDTWRHGVFVFESATVHDSYLDGDNAGSYSAANTSTPTGLDRFRIGVRAQSGGGTPFDGKIGDFRIYDKVLTSGEISSIRSGVDVSSGLIGHFMKNTDDLTDHSVNTNNATASGTTFSEDGPFG